MMLYSCRNHRFLTVLLIDDSNVGARHKDAVQGTELGTVDCGLNSDHEDYNGNLVKWGTGRNYEVQNGEVETLGVQKK